MRYRDRAIVRSSVHCRSVVTTQTRSHGPETQRRGDGRGIRLVTTGRETPLIRRRRSDFWRRDAHTATPRHNRTASVTSDDCCRTEPTDSRADSRVDGQAVGAATCTGIDPLRVVPKPCHSSSRHTRVPEPTVDPNCDSREAKCVARTLVAGRTPANTDRWLVTWFKTDVLESDRRGNRLLDRGRFRFVIDIDCYLVFRIHRNWRERPITSVINHISR